MTKAIGSLAGGDDRIEEGVGTVTERSIAIGSRVIWLDNIGSIRIVRGARSYLLLVLGLALIVAGATMLRDNPVVGLVVVLFGVGLVLINVRQKIENGLSIGTTDGRSTIIVSKNEQFLNALLDFLRLKINTRNAHLEGQFDIKNNVFKSEGGGIVVGDKALADDIMRRAADAPLAPARSGPAMDWASPENLAAAGRQASTAVAQASTVMTQASTVIGQTASDVGGRVARNASSPAMIRIAALVAVLAMAGGGYWAYTKFFSAAARPAMEVAPLEAPPTFEPRVRTAAASFDCATAAAPAEIAICGDDSLARLDADMGRAYAARLALDPAVRSAQRVWVDARNAECSADKGCLRQRIEARIAELTAPIAAPPAIDPSATPAAGERLYTRGPGLRFRERPSYENDVPILAETTAAGEPLDILETLPGQGGDWHKVRLPDGRIAYFKASLAVTAAELAAQPAPQ